VSSASIPSLKLKIVHYSLENDGTFIGFQQK